MLLLNKLCCKKKYQAKKIHPFTYNFRQLICSSNITNHDETRELLTLQPPLTRVRVLNDNGEGRGELASLNLRGKATQQHTLTPVR